MFQKRHAGSLAALFSRLCDGRVESGLCWRMCRGILITTSGGISALDIDAGVVQLVCRWVHCRIQSADCVCLFVLHLYLFILVISIVSLENRTTIRTSSRVVTRKMILLLSNVNETQIQTSALCSVFIFCSDVSPEAQHANIVNI